MADAGHGADDPQAISRLRMMAGIDEAQARFMLEAAGGNAELALQMALGARAGTLPACSLPAHQPTVVLAWHILAHSFALAAGPGWSLWVSMRHGAGGLPLRRPCAVHGWPSKALAC